MVLPALYPDMIFYFSIKLVGGGEISKTKKKMKGAERIQKGMMTLLLTGLLLIMAVAMSGDLLVELVQRFSR